MEDYKFCILTEEKDIIDFEKGLFNAFKDDSWILSKYQIFDNNRLKPFIPYNELLIMGLKKENELIGFGSMNFI